MATDGPSIYATLMQEAWKRSGERYDMNRNGSIEDVLRRHCAPASLDETLQSVRAAFQHAYTTGVTDGYQQALMAVDGKPNEER